LDGGSVGGGRLFGRVQWHNLRVRADRLRQDYTITGRTERYVDRGIIPRAISLIFSEVAERSDYTYTLYFSYMEVYNEMGYDLLNPDHETKALEDLPKVISWLWQFIKH